MLLHNDNDRAPDYSASNDFARPDDEDTAGVRGDGGNSLNTVVGLGARGGAGRSGNVGRLD